MSLLVLLVGLSLFLSCSSLGEGNHVSLMPVAWGTPEDSVYRFAKSLPHDYIDRFNGIHRIVLGEGIKCDELHLKFDNEKRFESYVGMFREDSLNLRQIQAHLVKSLTADLGVPIISDTNRAEWHLKTLEKYKTKFAFVVRTKRSVTLLVTLKERANLEGLNVGQ